MASIRAAEKAAGLDAYKGARERKSHVGAVGLAWTDEVEAALNDLAGQSARNTLVLLVSHICPLCRLLGCGRGSSCRRSTRRKRSSC